MAELESFKRHLLRNGKRQLTIEKHLRYMSYVLSLCEELTAQNVEELVFRMFEEGRSPGYLNGIVQVVRNYAKFIDDKELQKIKYFKVVETTKGILSDIEINKFLDITADDYEAWTRSRFPNGGGGHVNPLLWNIYTTFFTILAYSGLRPNELATMRLEQCDLGSKLFRLDATTKTLKTRSVSIHDALIPILEKHISYLDSNRLFPLVKRDTWKTQFTMRKNYLGIKRDKISTYSLRHSWVTRLLDEDANPHVMADMAGHSLEQQRHYYKLTSKSKRIAIQKDPLGRKKLTLRERMLQGRKALEDLGFLVTISKELASGFMFEVQEDI